VRSVLASCDLLVHPSHSEGFGAVLLEAMAAEKPVVATRCGGPEEIVHDGRTGYLVPVGDPPALAAAIRAVLSNPAAAAEMGRQGEIRLADFSLAAAARGTQDLDDEVVSAFDRDGDRRRKAAAERPAEIFARARRAAASVPPTAD
jgi:glycosyltransferase involved in cell wall biosynthesis